MPVTLDYQPPPDLDGSPEDRQLLRGVAAVNHAWRFACTLLFGLPFCLSLGLLPFHGMADEPGESGLRTILLMLGFSSPGTLAGVLSILSGKRIGRRQRLAFSVRWAAACTGLGLVATAGLVWHLTRAGRAAPGLVVAGLLLGVGAIVGLATYRALGRPSVRLLYEGADRLGATTTTKMADGTAPAAGAAPGGPPD